MKYKVIKIFVFGMIVLVLTFLVGKMSHTLLSNSLTQEVRIDEVTSRYISFNYAENDNYIIEVRKPKVVSDFVGKRLLRNNCFDFEVSALEEFVKKKNVEYEIIATPMENAIDSKYIKFYLTDQNNEALEGYRNVAPVLSVLPDDFDGKVIYSNSFSKSNKKDRYRLKIWISDKYKDDVGEALIFKIQVKVK